jgi:hypothetical protein
MVGANTCMEIWVHAQYVYVHLCFACCTSRSTSSVSSLVWFINYDLTSANSSTQIAAILYVRSNSCQQSAGAHDFSTDSFSPWTSDGERQRGFWILGFSRSAPQISAPSSASRFVAPRYLPHQRHIIVYPVVYGLAPRRSDLWRRDVLSRSRDFWRRPPGSKDQITSLRGQM